VEGIATTKGVELPKTPARSRDLDGADQDFNVVTAVRA